MDIPDLKYTITELKPKTKTKNLNGEAQQQNESKVSTKKSIQRDTLKNTTDKSK